MGFWMPDVWGAVVPTCSLNASFCKGILVYFLGGPQVTLRHLCNLEGMLDSAFVCPSISFF